METTAYFLEAFVIDETRSIFGNIQLPLGKILAELPVKARNCQYAITIRYRLFPLWGGGHGVPARPLTWQSQKREN